MLSHGVSAAVQDRLCGCSDGTPVAFCKKCKGIADHRHSRRFGEGLHTRRAYCRHCETDKHTIIKNDFPFASLLMLRELEGLVLEPHVHVKNREIN